MASEAEAEMYMNKNIFQASFEKSNPLETFGVSKPDIPFFLLNRKKAKKAQILAFKTYDPFLWPFATLRYVPLPIHKGFLQDQFYDIFWSVFCNVWPQI